MPHRLTPRLARFLLVAGLLAAGGFALAPQLATPVAAQGTPASPAPTGGGPAVPVTTDPVRVGAVPIEILANGIVASESVITIRTRVDGQIEQVLVQEGQLVKKGQPLFVQDSRFNRALLAQFEANLIKDRALLTRYTADLLRYQQLGRESVAAQQRLEQAQSGAA